MLCSHDTSEGRSLLGYMAKPEFLVKVRRSSGPRAYGRDHGGHRRHSFTGRWNRDHTFIAVDLHRRVQCSRAAANTLEKLPRAGTLHEKRLKQFGIVRLVGASFRLSFTGDR